MPTAGELDEANWSLLRAAVLNAYAGDAEGHAAGLRRLNAEVAADERAGAFIWYMLRYRVAQLIGRRPTPRDLERVTEDIVDRFARLVRVSALLPDTLQTVFRMAEPEREVRGGVFLVAGSAALGCLIDDPAQLDEMWPQACAWWRENNDPTATSDTSSEG